MPNLLNNFLRRLRERQRPGESLASVALELGVSKEYLSKVERGALSKPSADLLSAMLEAYRCGPGVRAALDLLNNLGAEGTLPDDGPEPMTIGFRLKNALIGSDPQIRPCYMHVTGFEETILQDRELEHILLAPSIFAEFFKPKSWIQRDYAYAALLRLLLRADNIRVSKMMDPSFDDFILVPGLVGFRAVDYGRWIPTCSDLALLGLQSDWDKAQKTIVPHRDGVELVEKLRLLTEIAGRAISQLDEFQINLVGDRVTFKTKPGRPAPTIQPKNRREIPFVDKGTGRS
jgi:hypothetical protein